MRGSATILNIKIEDEKWRNVFSDFIWCDETKKAKNFTDLVRKLYGVNPITHTDVAIKIEYWYKSIFLRGLTSDVNNLLVCKN